MARWKKGQSGNPGGRPKVVGEVRALAQEHSKDGIRVLVSIMNDTDEKSAVRVAAVKELLDRGLGKAIQGIELMGGDGGPVRIDLSKLPDEKLEQAMEVAKALSGDGG